MEGGTDSSAGRYLAHLLRTGIIGRREFIGRAAAAGLSLSTIGGILAACGGGQQSGGQGGGKASGTIGFIKGPHAANDQQLQQQIADDFHAKFPSVTVKPSLYDWAQMNTQLTTAFSSGSPPDVLYLVDLVYPFFAAQNVLEDMTPYVKDSSWKSDHQAIEPFAWNLATQGGKVWGVPALGAVYLVFVNQDLLRAAGVSDWNSSYDALTSAAQKLTHGNVYGFSVRTAVNDYAYWDWFPYIHNAGADLLSKDMKSSALDNASSEQAMQMLVDLHVKYKVTPPVGQVDWQGQKDLFKAGRIAIHHDETTLITEMAAQPPSFKWDIGMAPVGPKGQTVMGNFGFLCIAKASKNKEAAWEFIKYYASGQVISPYAQKVSLQVVRNDVVSGMWQNNAVMQRVQSEFVPKVQGVQPHPKMPQILSNFWPTMEGAYRGQMSGSQAIKQAASQISSLLG